MYIKIKHLFYWASLPVILYIIYELYNRYLSWGINGSNIITCLIICILSISIIGISLSIYRDILNPLSAYSFFIFFWGFSYLPISDGIIPLNTYYSYLLFLTTSSFIGGVLLGNIVQPFNLTLNLKIENRKRLLYLIVMISCIVFILECFKIGYLPILYISTKDVYGETLKNMIPILHYFVMLVNIIPGWAYLLYREGGIKKRTCIIIILISIFIIINYFSRQLLLLCFLNSWLVYNHFYKLSLKRKLLILSFPIFLFLGIGALRLLTLVKDQQSQKEYLSTYSGMYYYQANLIETYIALYASKNYTTFSKLVNGSNEQEYIGFGVYTLKPILTLTLLNRIDEKAQINPQFDTEDKIATYAADPYLDFGILGIILYNIFYGFITSIVYHKYKQGDIRNICIWATLLFCLIMNCFINYFNTFFVWLIIFINIFLIPKNNYRTSL